MLAAFLVGLALAAGMSWRIVQENARREVLQEAGIMMAQASAVRDYTTNEIDAAAGGPVEGALPAA